MKAFLKKNWAYLTIVVLVGLLLYNYTRPTPTASPIGKKQEKQIKVELGKKEQRIKDDTTAANRANAASDAAAAQGHAAAARAQQNRIQTHRKPYATSPVISDTAAQRLQRYLSNY